MRIAVIDDEKYSRVALVRQIEGFLPHAEIFEAGSGAQAVELLEKVLQDAEQSDAAKKDAVAQAAVVAQNVLKESNIENLIKAKGFEDCVVFLQNGECNVVVKVKESDPNNAVVIKDIVAGQAGVTYDKIKIVENQ